jgi:hypothetical protein
MLATEWHLIDERYGWLALGFSTMYDNNSANRQ